MLGAEGPLALWASLLNLQLARASLGFLQLKVCSFLLYLREGARMELDSLGLLALREYQPIAFPVFQDYPPCCRNARNQLYDISQCVNLGSEG